MVRIAQLASYDVNVGDNIATWNIRRVLTSMVEEQILWSDVDISIFHNPSVENDPKKCKEIFKDISDEHDMLIIGGGGLIEGDSGKFKTKWKLPFNEAILAEIDIPIVCFALGINYFRNWSRIPEEGKENIKLLVDKSALFSLRNDGSVDLFREFSDQEIYEVPDAGLVFDDLLQIPRKEEIHTGFLQTAWNNKEEQRVGRGMTEKNMLRIMSTMEKYDFDNFPHTMKDYSFPYKGVAFSKTFFQRGVIYDKFMKLIDGYSHYDYSVAMRGHGQMIAIGVNLPSIYLSTQDKVRDFSYRNGFTDYNVDILEAEWHAKLNEKIDRLKTDKEYLQNWYEIRDKVVVQYTKDFYDFCHKIKDLL